MIKFYTKMNIIRLVADLLHLLSFIIIIAKLLRTRSCRGVSCKTQEVYLVVFCCRYLDLFMYFVSVYNTSMKALYIGSTVFIIYLMRLKSPICAVSEELLTKLDIRQRKGRSIPTCLALPSSLSSCNYLAY